MQSAPGGQLKWVRTLLQKYTGKWKRDVFETEREQGRIKVFGHHILEAADEKHGHITLTAVEY